MIPYPKSYLEDVIEAQGKLFDFISYSFPDKDTDAFITAYMKSHLRKSIDEGQAYVCTMSAVELWDYYKNTETPVLEDGNAIKGFLPDWIGEFYAYYQWYYKMPSSVVVDKIPVTFLEKAYYGLHDLELNLAVKKVGKL